MSTSQDEPRAPQAEAVQKPQEPEAAQKPQAAQQPKSVPRSEIDLERIRARYGLLAVVLSNLAIAGVAIFGVWRLNGDKAVSVGLVTAAFTAVSSMTTAYLGIKAVSNTAKSIAQATPAHREPPRTSASPATPTAPAPLPPTSPVPPQADGR